MRSSTYQAQIDQWRREAIDGRHPTGTHLAGLAHIPRSKGGYAPDDTTLTDEPVAIESVEQEDGSWLVAFSNGHILRKTFDGFDRATERRDAVRWTYVGRWDTEEES